MTISIITLFPQMFDGILNQSILWRAQKEKLVTFNVINLRDFGLGQHKTVDGKAYGGGVGMVLRADVMSQAIETTIKQVKANTKPYVILTSPGGHVFGQPKAWQFSKLDHLIIICGHYEGVDERVRELYVDEEISIGDYVLTGGELPALVIADSITRLVTGVLVKPEAILKESFENGLLEHPHYTLPQEFKDLKVPEVLRSGNHQAIENWRNQQSEDKTKSIRPDLLKRI